MLNLQVYQARSDSFLEQLRAFVRTFKDLPHDEAFSFDFSDIAWVNPLMMLGVTSVVTEMGGGGFILPRNSNVSSYLETIRFPAGVSERVQVLSANTYIPICSVETARFIEGQKILSAFQDKVLSLGGFNSGLKGAVFFPISELVQNIFEHSECRRGYFLSQFYRQKGFVDITILDRGIGLAESYRRHAGILLNHPESVKKAIDGLSTSADDSRGRGIPKSIEAVCDKMNGTFMLITGNAAYISEPNASVMYDLEDFNWKGVILHMRVPRDVDPLTIDITELYE